MTLYAISLWYRNKESHFWFSVASHPAICTTLERAKEIVENNEEDMHGRNNISFILIEAVTSDVVQKTGEPKEGYQQWWYEWKETRNEGKYKPCKQPAKCDCNRYFMINMAIGL